MPDGFAVDRPSSSSTAACLLSSSAMACCRSPLPCRYTIAAREVKAAPLRSAATRRQRRPCLDGPPAHAGSARQQVTAAGRQGLVLLHASGDAFIRDLADSESVLVSPASLLYWEDTVYLSLHLEFPYVPGQHVRRVFWRSSRIWLRVCGPGRVIIDSACEQAEDARKADRKSFASSQRWDAPATTTTRAE